MAGRERVEALDVLRGLAVAGMILVNSPGSWQIAFAPLKHAEWDGWTATDLVFPTFLFAMGMAFGLSFPRGGWRPGERAAMAGKVARRTLTLIAIGLALNALPDFDLAHLRLPGVLQRIGLCYALVAAICLPTLRRGRAGGLDVSLPVVAGSAAGLLALYAVLLLYVPVPGGAAGALDSAGSLPAWFDRLVFGTGHLWRYGTTEGLGVTYDPEGLLSTLPATANVLAGVLAAIALRRAPAGVRLAWLAGGAVLLIALGLLLDPVLPINKRLWTPSFALFSSGAALLALALAMVVLPLPGARAAAAPLRVLGGNAILAYVVSELLGVIGSLRVVPWHGGETTPQGWGFAMAEGLVPNPYLASLLCALAITLLVTLLMWPLHRRGLHFRV